jgi:phage tail sheath gpL-like
MPTIPILGLPSTDVVPGQYAQVNFAQGAAGGSSGLRKALIIANFTSTDGIATADTLYGPDTPVVLASDADAVALFGKRSEARIAYKRFVRANGVTPVYVLTVADPAGTAAKLAITFTGTATATGFVRVYCGDRFVDVLISTGDTPTVIATACAAAVNSQQDWPVVGSFLAGVLTMTAAQTGVRGNWLRGSARVYGAGVGVTSSATAQGFFTTGATVDTWTTALTKIIALRFYYIVSACDGGQSDTGLLALATQISSQGQAATGIRQRVFVGSVDTNANTITIANGATKGNNARIEYINGPAFDRTPLELAAEAAGAYALLESSSVPECNFNGLGSDANTSFLWTVPAPLNASAMTHPNMVASLASGVTPIGVGANGGSYIVKRITSYCLTNSQADYRIRDAHKVTVCDFFADDLITRGSAAMSRKVLGDDPKNGQPIRVPNLITPREITAIAQKLTREYGDNGLLQDVQNTIDGISTIRDGTAPTRTITRVQPKPSDISDQQVWVIDQLSFTG